MATFRVGQRVKRARPGDVGCGAIGQTGTVVGNEFDMTRVRWDVTPAVTCAPGLTLVFTHTLEPLTDDTQWAMRKVLEVTKAKDLVREFSEQDQRD